MSAPAAASPPLTQGRARAAVYALLTANAVSMSGNVMANLAVPWFVLETTGSPARTGITAFFTFLPTIIAAALGGTLIDRLGQKRISVVADLFSGAAVALIPLLYSTVGLAYWQLLVLVFLGALLDAPGDTARATLLPEIAKAAGMPLERANAYVQAVQRGSRLAGAPLAGLLITTFGATTALWVDAATFAVSALLIARWVPVEPTVAKAGADAGYASQVVAGLRFIMGHRLIRFIVLFVSLINFLDAVTQVVFIVWVRENFGAATALGTLVAGSGAGALVGALAYGWVGPRLPRRSLFIGAFIAAALPYWIYVLSDWFPLVFVAAVSGGIAGAPLNPIIRTVLAERVPVAMRGRVFGAITASAYLAMPGGVLLGGAALEWVASTHVLLALAISYAASTIAMLFVPAFHEMDTAPEETAATGATPQTG